LVLLTAAVVAFAVAFVLLLQLQIPVVILTLSEVEWGRTPAFAVAVVVPLQLHLLSQVLAVILTLSEVEWGRIPKNSPGLDLSTLSANTVHSCSHHCQATLTRPKSTGHTNSSKPN